MNSNFLRTCRDIVTARCRRWAEQFAACHYACAIAWVVFLSFVMRIVFLPFILAANAMSGDPFQDAGPFKEASLIAMGVIGLVLGPIIETFLNQWLIFRIAVKLRLLPARPFLVIIVSGLLFGLGHTYTPGYVVSAFGTSLVLATAFWLRGAGRQAFWILVASHAVLNCVALIVALFLFSKS